MTPLKRKLKDIKLDKQQANPYLIISVFSILFIFNGINCEFTVTNPSPILYEFSKAVLEFSAIEQESREALLEIPVKDLIKFQLEPIEQQLDGLLGMISKIEKMEIPKSVVSGTITELEALDDKIHLADATFQQIVDKSNRKRFSAVARSENMLKFEKKIADMFNSKEENPKFFLLDLFDGLNFDPLSFSDEELMEMEMKNMTFSETGVILEEAGFSPKILANKLTRLGELIDRRSALFEITNKELEIVGDKRLSGAHLEEQHQVSSEIKEHIEEDGEYLNLTVRWILETGKVIDYLMEAVIKSEVNIKLYLHIRNNIMDELNELKKRIEKLQVPQVENYAHEEL